MKVTKHRPLMAFVPAVTDDEKDADDEEQVQATPTVQYITGSEAWELVRRAGIKVSKDVW